MSEPIISPWFFYFIDIAQALDNFFFILLICSGFASITCILILDFFFPMMNIWRNKKDGLDEQRLV